MKVKTKNTVWVLTSEYNGYDQHGAYFEAIWQSKPTHLELINFFNLQGETNSKSVMEALAFIEHLLAGGGQRGSEHMWYNLNEVELRGDVK